MGGWGVAGVQHLFSNITIYGNEFYSNEVGLEIGGYTGTNIDSIKVFNNLIYHNKGVGVRITRYDGPTGDFAMRNVSVINNTIYGNGTVGNGWDADNGGMNIFNISPVNMLIRNNIVSNNAVCTIHVSPEVLAGSLTIDYNFFDGFRNFLDEKAGTNPVYGIPLFVDSLRNDYHLQATSPCIDKGNPSQEYNDPADPNRPGFALYPAQGTLRNDMGAYGGPYASSSYVVIVAAPSAPSLAGPADGAKSVSLTPTLSWERAMGAVTYRLQVSLNSWFSTTVVNDSTIAETFESIGPLQNGTTYFWRINAKNEGGTSAWSQVRSFTTSVATPLAPAYYVSPTGNDSNPGTELLPWKTLVKAASTATAGVTVFIKQGIYRERLIPVNSGRADAPITFTCYPGDSVTITGKGMTPPAGWWGGMIWIESLKYIKISGLRVTNAANTGIHVETSSFITIEKNFLDSSYSPGIKVHGCNNAVIQGNEVVHACLRYEEECISLSATNIFEIRNNLVHDGMTEGIDVKYGSSNGIVSGNEVYNEFDRGGIYIDAWTEHQYNVEIYDNVCHDNASYGFAVTSEKGGLIEKIKLHHNKAFRNRLWGLLVVGWCGEPNQKYPIHNIELNQNESYENQIGIQIGGNVGTNIDTLKVYNNLTYHNLTGVGISGFDGPSGEHVVRNVEIVNNTIYGNGTSSTGWLDGGVLVTNISAGSILLRNNILSSNAAYTVTVLPETPSGIVTIDRNSIDGFRNFANEKAGTNPVYGVPFFADSLRHNFHLLSTSPCIDNGDPDQKYNDPPDPARPGYALYPASGTIRNDLGAYGGPYAGLWDLRTSVTRPQTPALNVPADSARGVSLTPMLSWNGILGAERYRVQLSTSATFGSRLVDDSMVTDCYRQVGPLLNNTAYYWRVNATNVAGTCNWSQVRSFTTIVAAPSVPTLAGPADSAKNVQLNAILSWNAVQGATLYHLQVSTASNFGSTVVNDSTLSTVSRSVGPMTLAMTYYWRVRAKNDGGWSAYSLARQFSTIRTTSVEQLSSEIPTEYSLSQNYPNPFNPSTRVRFGIPKSGMVSLKVFDLLGRELETVVAEELAPAYYQAVWKANVASGIYFYRIQAGDFVQTKKMILLH